MPRGSLLVLVFELAFVTNAAWADEPPTLASLASGMATAIVPLAVGGGLSAGSDGAAAKRAGFDVMAAGFALAPMVSHLVAREWRRALLFGALPLACSVAAIAILEGEPVVLEAGAAPDRIAFGTLLAVSLVSSTVGLVDSFMAGARGRPLRTLSRSRTRPTVALALLPGRFGLTMGGSW